MDSAERDQYTKLDNSSSLAGSAWLLAIDTSTDQAGIALFDGHAHLGRTWPGGRLQTVSVLPEVEHMLLRAGLELSDVGAVAVASGPGSFTGLRVGLSIAKGFAISEDRAVIGVNTLDVTAAPFRALGRAVIAAVPAGRGRVVWTHYPDYGAPGDPSNTSFAEFLAALSTYPEAIVAGELTREQRAEVEDIHPRLASPAMSIRRPEMLAELGFLRWKLGGLDDPTHLEPLYIHGQPNPR